MPDFSTIDNRCLDSWHILISGQFKHGYLLNISCSNIFDSCKIKRVVTNLTQLGYVNIYDKNRYLENFSKAAVSSAFHDFIFLLLLRYYAGLFSVLHRKRGLVTLAKECFIS